MRRIVTSVGGGDLSHDGRQIAYFEFAGGRVELRVAGRDGSAAHAVAVFEPGKYYLLSPRWSPDDRFIAYHRGYVFEHDVFVVPSTGGEPRQVTAKERLLRGFAWRPDGSGIVFSSPRGATTFYLPTMNLWTVDLGGQGLRQVTFGEVSYVDPDLSPGGTLVASRVRMVSDIWKFPTFGVEAENMQGAVRLTHQTSQLQTPSSSPDGMELVYLSDGGGHANLWVTSLRTGQSRQITYEQDPQVVMGVPVWSTDGQYIAFFSDRTKLGYGGLWLVDPHGSGLRELVPDAGWASWSRDGRWVYYSRTLPPRHLQKIPVGGGQPITVRTDNATRPAIAADGTLYYIVDLPSITGAPDYEIRAARPEGGPSRVLARIPAYRVPSWQLLHPVVSPDGKWLAVTLSDGVATNIWALSTADGSMRRLTDFGTRPTFIARRVSWSADGRFIYAAVGEGDADVVMLEGLMPPGASGRSARGASP